MSAKPQRKRPVCGLGGASKLRKKIARAHDGSGDELREKGNGQDEIAQRFRGLHHAAINVERVGEGVEGVERDADRQKNVEMRRLIDDADLRHEPFEILEQEISVLEEPQHAQIHADAGHQPDAPRMASLGLGDSGAEPKIHRGGGKEQRGKGRIPGAVENVARGHEQVFSQRSRTACSSTRSRRRRKKRRTLAS